MATLLGGCSADPGGELETNTISQDWKVTQRVFPFVGDNGETVCAERTRVHPDGFVEVDREWYLFDKINDKLRGRDAMAPGLRNQVNAAGLTRVASCDDARRFIRLKNAYLESQPSQPPEPPSSAPLPPEEEGAQELLEKIRDGFLYDHWPTVRLRNWDSGKSCSAFLINRFALLTAAHCFPGGSFNTRVSIDYGEAFAPDWCISDNSPNCGSPPSQANIAVRVHRDYTGTADTEDDIAVAFVATEWEIIGNNPDYFIRLTATDPGEAVSFAMHGYGATAHNGSGSGWGRRSNGTDGISWSTNRYWLAYATSGFGHPCKGDSGSPAVNFDRTPYDMAIGVFSNFEQVDDNACPRIGDKFRYTKINSKLSWLEGIIGACSQFSSNGWSYRRCW